MEDPQQGADVGELALGPPRAVERVQAQERRDRIVEAMWQQYQATLRTRGV
jgi:hypothetical protein